MKLQQQIEKIKDYTGITLSIKDKELYYGGWLDLRGTGITSLPDNLTVGGSLYLEGCTGITSLPDNLTVGGSLYLPNGKSIKTSDKIDVIEWNNYILADGIFTEVVSRRGNVWHVRKIARSKVFYLVTDGEGHYAHGDTLEEAKQDLIFKITKRNADDYRDLTLESTLS